MEEEEEEAAAPGGAGEEQVWEEVLLPIAAVQDRPLPYGAAVRLKQTFSPNKCIVVAPVVVSMVLLGVAWV